MVLPYRQITTSGSGVLALCHGRPLVVPDLPGLAELPDDAVIRYDGTEAGLAAALAGIVTADASVLAKMSSAADAYCAATTWSEIAEKTLTEMAGRSTAQIRTIADECPRILLRLLLAGGPGQGNTE